MKLAKTFLHLYLCHSLRSKW